MQNLESLSLIDVRVSAATLASLLDGPALSKLRSLVLWSTPLRDVGAEALAASPTLSRLDALRVDTLRFADEVRGVGFGAAFPVFPSIGPSATGNARKTPSRKAARVVRGEGFEPP